MTDRTSTHTQPSAIVVAFVFTIALALSGCAADKAPDDTMDDMDTSGMDVAMDTDPMNCGPVDDRQTCMCGDGTFSNQVCQADGTWSACDCGIDIDCTVTDWTDYGECSVMCGGGMETRTRLIVTPPQADGMPCPELMESRACNTQSCENCTDGMQNNGEEGIDCGGPCPLGCPGHTIDNVDVAGSGMSVVTLYESAYADIAFDFRIATPECGNCRTQLIALTEQGTGPDQYTIRNYECLYDDIPGSEPTAVSAVISWPSVTSSTAEIRVVQTFESDCTAGFTSISAPSVPRGPIYAEVTGTPITDSVQLPHAGSAFNLCVNLVNFTVGDSPFNVDTCRSNSEQRFTTYDNGALGDRFISGATGRCLSVEDSATANGTLVRQTSCGMVANQTWRLHARDGGYQFIVGHSNKCLQVSGNMGQGALLEQWDCFDPGGGNYSAQLFSIIAPI